MKNAFPKEFLDAQGELLLEYREKVVNKMRVSREDIQMGGCPEAVESGDVASTHIGEGISIELHEKDIHLLREIDEALARIEGGTYGQCEETGEMIGKRRLERVPWTRLSIEAARDREEAQASILSFAKAS